MCYFDVEDVGKYDNCQIVSDDQEVDGPELCVQCEDNSSHSLVQIAGELSDSSYVCEAGTISHCEFYKTFISLDEVTEA